MAEIDLHIVSFDIPYPADYGGVIDVFYKIKALSHSGLRIHLHCFEYGRKHAQELEEICVRVDYYTRSNYPSRLLQSNPFIVCTRDESQVLYRIQKNPAPVLLEGLHTTFHLAALKASGIPVLVRTHNIEHEYYANLAEAEKNLFRKLYFLSESAKLKSWEPVLRKADYILPISAGDTAYFSAHFSPEKVIQVQAFHPYEKIASQSGSGKYLLYHGNLSVAENNRIALYLVREVFSRVQVPAIVAGHAPSDALRKAIEPYMHITLVENPDADQMENLIRDAHIHVMPSFDTAGLRLKLLHALFAGRHVLVNDAMVKGSGLSALCQTAESSTDFVTGIERLMQTPFSEEDKDVRSAFLEERFKVDLEAQKILTLIRSLKKV